jgi:tetrapyrrole methylase family protein/MazG family protein
MISIVGLGPGDQSQIPQRNLEALRSAERVILRTSVHPAAAHLSAEGIQFETCDELYETAESFEKLYLQIAQRVLDAGNCAYAVPGHPLFGEESVRILLDRTDCEIFGAPSFVDAVLDAIQSPIAGSLQVWNAYDPTAHFPDPRSSQIVYNLDSKGVASDVKLWLLRFFPPDHAVTVVSGWLSGEDSRRFDVLLSELDHQEFDPLTSAFIGSLAIERPFGFYGLVDVVDKLLGPDGCPWDREQTHESLKKHMLEETYEAIEAIDSGDADRLCEELGDVLLQPLMHSQMDAIEGLYDIDDVIEGITDKLVRRHPHVFGDIEVNDAKEVLNNWDMIKQSENPAGEKSVLDGVPTALPALLRAYEVSKRAARVGFEWPDFQSVLAKVEEERAELEVAIVAGDPAEIEAEFGDLLFALVNVARWKGVEPEEALRKMVTRFSDRFAVMEQFANKPLKELAFAEWDALWERAKQRS